MVCENDSTGRFKQIIFVAPDIDTDIFRREIPTLRPLAKKISLYVSGNDRALKLSQELHGYPRLGEAGANLAVFEGVDTIDISAAGNRRFSGHIYHLYNPPVIEDLKRLIDTGDPPGRRPHLKEAKKQGLPYWRLSIENK
jgi:esterase/lipase superfamily enzyme